MLNQAYFNSMEQSKNSKHQRRHHSSHRSPSATVIDDEANQYLNSNSYHQISNSTPLPTSCSAYFLHRLDLADYTIHTLKQIVDSVIAGTKSKGLKVNISLPNEGLVIENIPDPNQSWMYKTSKLLYFWRDPYYLNTIVVITINRSRHRSTGPYSASIFRLRGNESVHLFLQRAQQFFGQLSISNIPRNHSKTSVAKSATVENISNDHKERKQSKHHSPTNKQTSRTAPIRLITRTEFDPGRTKPDSIANLYHHRTYSETTVSSDTQTTNSNKQNNNYDDDDDDRMTTVSNNLPDDCVVQLMRELKELRNEIASLKLEGRFTPVRSTSTSPMTVFTENSKQTMDFSPITHAEVDAETQTGFSLINRQRKQSSIKTNTKMNKFDEETAKKKRKTEQSNTTANKRTSSNSSNNIESDREEIKLINYSQTNGSLNEKTSSRAVFSLQSQSMLKTNQNNFTPLNGSSIYTISNHGQSSSNSTEEDSFSYDLPVIVGKQIPKVLPKNLSSSTSMPAQKGEIVSFYSSIENTDAPTEHIYENVPVLIQMDSNKNFYYNIPIINKNDQSKSNSYIHVTINDDRQSEIEKQYLSQLFGQQNGISLLLPQQPNSSSETQETTSTDRPKPQQVLFANHLTNPLFNIDKQLLANTIANQFGVDLSSPYLQQLITNQHLFVSHKRTFANMVWQITPEEENALCSSPPPTRLNILNGNIINSNSSTTKSILKANKTLRLTSKKQRISWDSALE